MFSISTIDPDESLKLGIDALMGDRLIEGSVYKTAECLAEWGVNELAAEDKARGLDIVRILEQTENRTKQD